MAERVLSRLELAVSGTFLSPPNTWRHSITPNKPVLPPATRAALNEADQDRFDLWAIQRESGTLGAEEANVSADLRAAMDAFEDYLASASYIAWRELDTASREWQYRLRQVDIAQIVQSAAVVPPDADPTGIGTPAPGVEDVVTSADEAAFSKLVSSGGLTPEVVFDETGEFVTG